MTDPAKAGKWTYLGLCTTTLSTLMFEILLTRIFSVTMWYHYAFVAISLAMFGMTLGALIVYLLPRVFVKDRVRPHLCLTSLFFAVAIVVCFLVHLGLPLLMKANRNVAGPLSVHVLVLTYIVVSIPFVFSGMAVSLALTRFPTQIGKLYGVDLAGAALGCFLLILVLDITDGPTAVIVVATLAAMGAVCFAMEARSRKLLTAATLAAVLLGSVSAWHTILVHRQSPVIRLAVVKGQSDPPLLYEKWNSFSRVDVVGDPEHAAAPTGWGLSPTCPAGFLYRRLYLRIDAGASTILVNYDGKAGTLEHLKYDITNLAHWIRPGSRVAIVGSGGGRDVLSALAFEQESIKAIEINENAIRAVNGRFGDFTGHLDKDPRITFVHDEARNYLASCKEQFDLIQISLIDTWAATVAGAYVLAENSLYTTEAFRIFLQRLSPRGVLTISRWFFAHRPGEAYRLVSLASASLMNMGIENPRDHIMLAKIMAKNPDGQSAPDGVCTILVSREAFSEQDIRVIEERCAKMQFEVVLSPKFAEDKTFEVLASGKNLATFTRNYPINITPPTDDSPFFFHMLRLRDMLDRQKTWQGAVTFNMQAISMLGILLITVCALTFLCIIVPLILTTRKETLRGSLPLFLYFAGIGLGFMLVEISQMQRLIVFLGHPTYGLSVVLFSLLLSSGAGSAFSQRFAGPTNRPRAALICLGALLGALALFGSLTPATIRFFEGAGTMLRITVSVGILSSIGFFMGMAFPLGMRAASSRSPTLTPWLFGINGAMSVCASVLAVAIALSSSISASFWTGVTFYSLSFLAYVWSISRRA